jgi:hypothetical protein
MTDLNNAPKLLESTEPAIDYSTCYNSFFKNIRNYFKNKKLENKNETEDLRHSWVYFLDGEFKNPFWNQKLK